MSARDVDSRPRDARESGMALDRRSRCRRGLRRGRSARQQMGRRHDDVELIHDNRHRLPASRREGTASRTTRSTVVAGVPVTSPAQDSARPRVLVPDDERGGGDRLTGPSDGNQSGRRRAVGSAGIRDVEVSHVRAMRSNFSMPGAQSPKESWLRLVLIQAGLPRPQTQIPVLDEFGDAIAYLDMGWEDVKVAVEYDGEQHRSDRRQYTWDVRRSEMLERLGWIVDTSRGRRPARRGCSACSGGIGSASVRLAARSNASVTASVTLGERARHKDAKPGRAPPR